MTKRDWVQLKVDTDVKKEFKEKVEKEGFNITSAIGAATEEKFNINLTQAK